MGPEPTTMKATSHGPDSRASCSHVPCILAVPFGFTAPLSAQNLFLENRTDCEFKVFIRYADVGCDWSYYPKYTPSNVCGPNQGLNPYPAPPQTQTSYTTPNGSEICGVYIRDIFGNVVLDCGCALVYCHLDDYDCGGPPISIDITVTATTTTIKWY